MMPQVGHDTLENVLYIQSMQNSRVVLETRISVFKIWD